jgi:type VI secretion system (T6SS) effector TldE1-like protein
MWMTHDTKSADVTLRSQPRDDSARPSRADLYRLDFASLQNGVDSEVVFAEPDSRSEPVVAGSSFGERFAVEQPTLRPALPLSSFDDRFAGEIMNSRAPVRSVVAPSPAPVPVVAAAVPMPRPAARSAVAQAKPKQASESGFQLASASSTALAYAPSDQGKGMTGSALKDLTPKETPTDPSADVDASRTAIYDITARTVYLPNGRRLEAHSGLGGYMDDVRYVNQKATGPTPPNVYDLKMREALFHGVRAIRLIPTDESKMYGRDGILAHTYLLGPKGESNGCVSFADYQAFLDAFDRGEITRLVVVEHLAQAPSAKTASDWLANTIKDIFRKS